MTKKMMFKVTRRVDQKEQIGIDDLDEKIDITEEGYEDLISVEEVMVTKEDPKEAVVSFLIDALELAGAQTVCNGVIIRSFFVQTNGEEPVFFEGEADTRFWMDTNTNHENWEMYDKDHTWPPSFEKDIREQMSSPRGIGKVINVEPLHD